MLFLCIYTFGSENREATFKRCAQGEQKVPEGVQLLQEVVDLTKNRIFRICEVTDPKAIMKANMAWNDLGEVEIIPVMGTEEMLEAMDRMNEKEHRRKKHSNPLEFISQPQL